MADKQEPKTTTESKQPSRLEQQRAARERLRADALEIHEAYQLGENYDGLSAAAHIARILTMLGFDPGFGIEGTQLRRQCGLEELDVCRLAIDGTLRERIEQSRREVADKTLQNQADRERERLLKLQSENRQAFGAR